MKTHHLVLFIFLLGGSAFGQSRFYQSYDWEKAPALTAANEKYKAEDFYSVNEKHIIEFAYNANDELTLFETRHVKTHINNDKGVEARNKMYIPTGSVVEMINIKARCITASGKIINLDKSNIKEVDDLDNKGPYTIFAYEGVEPNSDVEYIYTAKYYVRTGRMITTQFAFPQQSLTIDFISPKNLEFELKCYNGLPEFKKDTTDDKINHLYMKTSNVEEFDAETYSADDADEQYFSYHLRYNTAKSHARLYSWSLIGNDLAESYTQLESGDVKAVTKFIDKSGALKQSSDFDKLATLEAYFKKNVQQISKGTEKLSLEKALSQKQITSYLSNKFFAEASKQLGINYELVFTCNRFESEFDGSMEGYNQLDDILIYYPSLSKYLVPDNAYSRLGFPPYHYLTNKGLFVKITDVAGVLAAISKVKTIGYSDGSLSQNTINAKIRFTENDFVPVAQMSHNYTGYTAYNIQPVFYLLDNEQKKEVVESILKQPGDQTQIKGPKVENEEPENIYKKPIIISGEVELPQLIEKAGDKYLFKLGLIIGPQSELYQEKVRKTDMVIEYTHGFVRNLELEIPKGYKLTNPQALKFNVVLNQDGKETSYFKSDYQLDGNKLTVSISEQYLAIRYPKAVYNDFKAVINAAADFNKVSLIFEKN